MAKKTKPKLLFVSESVTLAHFARPFALSNRLSASDYDIHFACATPYQQFLGASKHSLHTLPSIPPEQFKQALAKGNLLYDFATLKNYVEADLALIDTVKPDLIIGDFRISLAVSARLAKIPYAALSNAYWSPYAPKHYPLPCLPLTRYLGLTASNLLFQRVAPVVFKAHARPMRQLQSHFGLPKTELDLRRVYTEADYTWYADLPSLFPLTNPPSHHVFIGPVLWSPPVPEPAWWHHLPTDRPIVYVCLGSSGSQQVLQVVLNALSREDVTVIASLAGVTVPLPQVSTIFTADYLNGDAAVKRADLVICNGGSLTCQQALAHGKPIIGIADNMDQFLNMAAVVRVKAGLLLRSDNLTAGGVAEACRVIKSTPTLVSGVTPLQQEIAGLSDNRACARLIAAVLVGFSQL